MSFLVSLILALTIAGAVFGSIGNFWTNTMMSFIGLLFFIPMARDICSDRRGNSGDIGIALTLVGLVMMISSMWVFSVILYGKEFFLSALIDINNIFRIITYLLN